MTELDDGPCNPSLGMKIQEAFLRFKLLGVFNHDVDAVPAFPVPGKQFSAVIQGNKTDFMLCTYDDCIFVLATQLEKMGTLLLARKEEGYGAQITFSVNVLMGKHDEPMLRACARQLIENISSTGSSRPLLLSLGLKDHSMGTLKGIIEAVGENKIW